MPFSDCVRPFTLPRAPISLRCNTSYDTQGVMMADNSLTGKFRINLPQELLAAAAPKLPPKKEELQVEGWRDSWLSRISEALIGKE